jgi:Tocopherol cyclase
MRDPAGILTTVSEEDNVSRLADGTGFYEVWFLTFTDPSTGAGYWVRSTHRAPKRGSHEAGVWFARFDPGDPAGTFGIHRRSDRWSISTKVFAVRIGDCIMSSGHSEGEVRAEDRTVRWELDYPTGGTTWRLLPDPFYRGGLAPTKPFSPNVDSRVDGTVWVDDQPLEIRNAPAQQGHLFGTRHADRWAWAHCGTFEDEDAVVHALTARGRRGPFITPFVTSIGVRWEGRWNRLVQVSRRSDFGLGSWKIDVQSRQYRLTGRIEAPPRAMLRATYRDPDDTLRYCHNSEISSSRLVLFERRAGGFDEVAVLESRGTTHAEWAGRTPAAAVERTFVEVGP